MIYKYRDRDFTGINGHMFAHKGISKGGTPFYVEDLSGQSNTLSIAKNNSSAPTLTIEKSTDGKNWTVLGTTSTTAITATIPANGKLYLRCSTDFWARSDAPGFPYNHISVSKHCSIGGNIMSLLYGAQFTGNETVFPSGHQQVGVVFRRLFIDCDTIIRADALVLPATTLANYCYQYMFYGCTSLTTAPELPATKLAEKCYYSMFEGCTSLTKAPELPATRLAEHCYQYMFWSCTSLTKAPELPATKLADYCYGGMFSDCTALSEVKCLATNISAYSCLDGWLSGVARSGTFYKKAGVVYKDGVSGIPKSWTVVEV